MVSSQTNKKVIYHEHVRAYIAVIIVWSSINDYSKLPFRNVKRRIKVVKYEIYISKYDCYVVAKQFNARRHAEVGRYTH